MDKVHAATRPAWAMGKAEGTFTLLLSLSVTLIGYLLFWLHEDYLPKRKLQEPAIDSIIEVLSAILFFGICGGGFYMYGRFQTRRYPGSYAYCFERRDVHTGEAKKVLGHFILESRTDGSMAAYGASFDWNGREVDEKTQVCWHSIHVGATIIENVSTCFILYDVDLSETQHELRPYTHGLLQFKRKADDFGIISHEQAYVGTMQAVDPPTTRVAVYNKAYAERIGRRMSAEDLKYKLNQHGLKLIVCYESIS